MHNIINFNELGFKNLRKELDEELILNYTVKGKEIKIKTTIPTELKIELASKILSNSIDDDNSGFFNPLRLKIVGVVEGMEYYSNIVFDINKYDNIYDIYDILEDEGFIDILFTQTDFSTLCDHIEKCAKNIVKYNNSMLGLLNNVKNNNFELSNDLKSVLSQIKTDPEVQNFLENIMPNLG